MAPITTTTAGLARQTIDDPDLVSLLRRLHSLNIPEAASANGGGHGEDAVMAESDANRRAAMQAMVEGLVKELEGVPRWRFQEQADLYEWIKPLNAIDAALTFFMEEYPALLLIPPQSPVMCDDPDQPNSHHDNNRAPVPPEILSAITTILTFLSTLLRNSTNKAIFHSSHELSSLLASSNDTVAHLALECLATLSQPPLLHRQQAPESGSHSTELSALVDGGRVMRRILGCAMGWGSKGTELGLLNCVEMDDDAEVKKKYADERSGGLGRVSFQCRVPFVGKSHISKLLSVEVSWEDMYANIATRQSQDLTEMQMSSSTLQEEPTEKRRKVAPSPDSKHPPTAPSSDLQLKSTSQLFFECLGKLHQQLNTNNTTSDEQSTCITVPPEKQFNLLTQIRLARSFHTTNTRISAIEFRLRAIICLLSSQPNQDTIGAFFSAQPELCGELVDLIRPTVSVGNMGGAAGINNVSHGNAILSLADSPQVPYHIRTLAIEALTALVARRDSTGNTNNVARQVNVLAELGVGKGQYLGMLPTLIRYSLAALNSFLICDAKRGSGVGKSEDRGSDKETDIGQELGMIFLQCTKPPSLPQKDREERALEFIDSVLTLTSAVVSVPSGTAALTDCGIIPALVSTIALDSQVTQRKANSSESSLFVSNERSEKESYSESLLKFITAQAIQILEGAIVTHSNALTAFHELKGVDILVQRLNIEVELVKQVKFPNEGASLEDVVMDNIEDKPKRSLQAARRVLLFSAVNCLTVVFHQQEANGANASIPSGGAQLRKPELMHVLLDIMDNADSYGGVLAGLVATLLSDVMNADPQVVHYVHDSGLAKSFLSLIMGKNNEMKQVIGANVEEWGESPMEACADLVMAIPNVILALSLTEAGAKSISKTNPFPALLSVFCSPKFAMPNSRCLLNEMAAIVGTGMDEVMRHNPNLKSCVMKAIVQVMNRIVFIGKNLTMREEHLINESHSIFQNVDLETSRTYLMQYSHNIAQLLEQILHNEDHVPKFVDVGGVDSLLELSRWSITPAGKQFVTHVTCLSSPSIGSVTHTNISSSFGTIVKILATHSDSCKITKKIIESLEFQLNHLRMCVAQFRDGSATGPAGMRDGAEDEFSFINLLQSIPAIPVYDIEESQQNERLLDTLASLYRSIISVDWLTRSLATTIRTATQRMADTGSVLFNRQDRDFQKLLSSESFKQVVDQLSLLHRSALWEVCRVRTEPGFDERDIARNQAPKDPPLVYRMRIVCQEGAICRNGIDIDGCDNIGNVEMGEIVEAYDRCINSSGVLRYQTSRGWVSELTRGHGRENIAEIISVRRGTGPPVTFNATQAQKNLKRIECGVPDLCSVSASMLARLHSSHADLFSSFERIMVSRIRSLNVRDPFQGSGIPPHIISVACLSSNNLQKDFRFADIDLESSGSSGAESELNFFRDAAKCMYLGNMLNLLHTCLYAEKRTDRRGSLNIPLLLCLLTADGWEDGICSPETTAAAIEMAESNPHKYAFLSAIRFVLKHSLRDMAIFAVKDKAWREEQRTKRGVDEKGKASHHQRLSRAVASSFPPVISLLQRLISRQMIAESPISASMTKMKPEDLKALISHSDMLSNSTLSYNPNQFARGLHIQLARISFEIFSDDHLCSAPAHILHPWISYMSNVISSLEDAAKRLPITTMPLSILRDSSVSGRIRGGLPLTQTVGRASGLGAMLGPTGRIPREPSEPFQASEESIERLVEMGFGRDHAIESLEMVGSNRVDVAMEYALSNPPSSPATLERRRTAREQRRLRQEQLAASVFSPQLENTAQEVASMNEQGPSAEAATSGNHEGADSTPSGEVAASNDVSESIAQKEEEESKPKALSQEELKLKKEDELEEKDAARARRYLESVKEDITTICLNIIEAGTGSDKDNEEMESSGNIYDGIGGGHSDVEHVTVVVASFLVDICSRYTADVTKISTALIRRLKSNLRVKSRSHCQVKIGCETNFSALAHASVIFFRAIPRSRPLILRHGVVSCLLHCIRNVTLTTSLRNGSDMVWPCWLAPSLLLLELMAQPTTISLEHESELDAEAGTTKMGKKGEFAKVMAEHKKQTAAMVKSTKHVFSLLYKEGNPSHAKKKKGKFAESTKQRSTNQAGGSATTAQENSENKEQAQHTALPPLPTLFPLIHFEDAEASMRLCLQLLGLRSARKLLDPQQLEKACPPPTIAHATLSLLVRVLHFQKIASLCLNMGGADVVLSLPRSCHFIGNKGLVTLALRRMLEDESTLQAMMETEIRSQVTKLFKKQHRGSSITTERPKASMKPFIQAVTPLICRAPFVFVRAIACSVRLEPKGDESSSLSSSRDARVILLTNEERARHSKLLGLPVVSNIHCAASPIPNRKAFSQDDQATRTRGRSKSPHPSKKDKPDPKRHHQFDGTPPSHITSLLLTGALRVPLNDTPLDANRPFLLTHDYLDILSDLVLAIPSCGAAVHRFKLPGELSIHHALSGCPDPPQTAVSFLLHRLVTQPRSLLGSNEKFVTDANERKQALMKARTSQASARLIVTLIARSGEGRRRVVSDLLFALSCGRINNQQLLPSPSGTYPIISTNVIDQDFEMQALQTWGELCMGIAAPRSVRVNASQDPNSSLSFEVVKLMLDQGAAHALFFAIDRIILCHPMASSVACSLLRPLEIFTRTTVYSKVLEMAEKDRDKRTRSLTECDGEIHESKESRRMTFGPSNRSESAFADDEMLEDGFDAHNADTHSEERDLDNDIVVGDDLDEMDVYSEESEDSETSEDEMEIRLGNVDFSDGADDEEVYSDSSDSESGDDNEIDEDEESDESNDSHSEEDSEESELSEEEDEVHENENEDMFIDGTEEEIDQDEAGWDHQNDELFDEGEGDDNDFEDPDAGNEVADEMGEWTTVDAGTGGRLMRELPGGIGNMIIDVLQQSRGPGGSIRGGQGLQAVENMLSNFLREGRVQELEETLGIRVVRNGRDSNGRAAVGLRVPFVNSRSLAADEGRSENSLATTNPAITVHQTTAPEAGYGVAVSSSRSLAEVLPMEYMFGGPASGAGSEYYFRRLGSDGDQELDLSPPGFDNDTSDLFPGGLAASTHSRQSIVPHPLLAGVDLPPINALLISDVQTATPDAADAGARSLARMGSYVRTPGGGFMRINRGSAAPLDSNAGRSSTNTLTLGWTYDGLSSEQSTEEFGSLFGQALLGVNQAFQDDVMARNEARSNVTSSTSQANLASCEINGDTGRSSDGDEAHIALAAEPEVSTAGSGENVDVSSLTISQQESDTHQNIPTSTEQPDPSGNHESDADDPDAEPNDADMIDAEDLHIDETSAIDQDTSVQIDSNQTGEQNATGYENGQPEAGHPDDAEVAGNPVEADEGGELTCPPDVDVEVFNSLPFEMQQEICREHQDARTGIAAQIGESSGLDPEALAALPEDMRQEIIEQERQHRRREEREPAADPRNAEDMDNANFLASLAPDLRQEILLTADEAFLQSLPPQIMAEAHVLRERVASQHRIRAESQAQSNASDTAGPGGGRTADGHAVLRRRLRNGKLRVEADRPDIVYTPPILESLGPLLTGRSVRALINLFYLLSPIQRQRIFQKFFLNLFRHSKSRGLFLDLFAALLNGDKTRVLKLVAILDDEAALGSEAAEFPPTVVFGTPPESLEESTPSNRNLGMYRRRSDVLAAATSAASIPASVRGSSKDIPPIVARRIIVVLSSLTKSSPRICMSMIYSESDSLTCLDRLLDLLKMNLYLKSAKNLEQLLCLLETVVHPLSLLPNDDSEIDLSPERSTPGVEWMKVPRVVVTKERLHLLVNALRLESCNDTSFAKVNTISRRLSRVEANRECILGELASVAQGLGAVAIRDLKSVCVRLSSAANLQEKLSSNDSNRSDEALPVADILSKSEIVAGAPSSAVSFGTSTSNSEIKFLRVLQTLHSLCNEFSQDGNITNEGSSPEFALLIESLDLESLWKELEACLRLVSVLEGVAHQDEMEENAVDGEEHGSEGELEREDPLRGKSDKKLQNSVAGLITRFLPAIEAFFIVNGTATLRETDISTENPDSAQSNDKNRVVQFASSNKVLLNALLRSNPHLLEKGLKAMVQIPKCRPYLDFDVKRQWFKTQVRRLRQQASRRHGSLRLNLRRKHVFEDSFRAFIHRTADELRGRLHITFQNEEGVDAGGLSREFFAILAKEMFNPNYALFMSTEDGCTFQPNPNSSINLDDLNYFRFVGRIVGKAVTDGFLLDAHFTRSLYKHMLGIKPTHHDMQAIDPDYYKNLQLILEHNLEDIGVELTFSTEDHSFGRSQIIDLIPNGRNIAVTDETKEKYVDLVCQHRMTTAIEKQIKAYLEGFHEMVDKDLISIFNAKELELLISGMPEIDIHDLKKNTDYNGYRPTDKEIVWFWNIMFSLSRSEKAAFLQFVTGSSKVPLAGFSELQGMRGVQKFSINKASGSAGALMSAHTCFNALDLPVYTSEEEMKEKLLYAISEGGGGFLFA
eukprot:CCRYP_008520-RB/>CCRYP_008520-RB protein AED:0.03 eAED:0.03 QI:213/1/1/1/1/1/14/495/4469